MIYRKIPVQLVSELFEIIDANNLAYDMWECFCDDPYFTFGLNDWSLWENRYV